MRSLALSVSMRFFVALVVLLAALSAVAWLGLHGMHDVQAANRQLYADNLLTEQASSQLGSDLDRAQAVTLDIAATSNAQETAGLKAQLEAILIPKVNADIAQLLRAHAHDPPSELAQIQQIPRSWRAFLALADNSGLVPQQIPGAARSRHMSPKALAGTLTHLIAFVAQRRPIELDAAADAYDSARHTYSVDRFWLLVAGAIALLAVAAMARVGVTLKRLLDRQRLEEHYASSESEYIDILQVTESEDEAQELLRRQLERSFDGTNALVLTRNNSADRLEPKTSLAAFESLREPMIGARPRSCLAMRLGRGHAEGGESEALQGCELCGGLPGVKTCEPLLVSGEVIGAVLVDHDRCPTPRDRQRIRETVSQAAPVLGNLRNLAMAQLRAATDGLTGLPNHRAAQDTLKRLVAQASRTNAPLAALIIDVDHFKRINDVHGHDRGDDVLAAVGVGLAGVARESDFVARYGGEEFLLLLPSTDRLGAVHVAEATRNAIASISLPGVELAITASVGVAVLPDDAGDPVSLFRAADRALYTAKRNGRNRVESAAPDESAIDGELGGAPATIAPAGLSS